MKLCLLRPISSFVSVGRQCGVTLGSFGATVKSDDSITSVHATQDVTENMSGEIHNTFVHITFGGSEDSDPLRGQVSADVCTRDHRAEWPTIDGWISSLSVDDNFV